MFSLERELTQLRDSGAIDDATAAPLIAVQRRDVVNVYGELRFLIWAAVMAIATGAGILVSKNLDRIGPIAVGAALGVAAAACYAWAFWKRKREAALGDDYILLLGALLLSADIGYIEHTWHLLGRNWDQHLLLLAALHAATAYFFESRLVLSLSLTSLAAYFGIQRDLDTLFGSSVETAARGLICAAIVFAWRFADARVRRQRTFAPVFEHFATNLAFWSALILAGNADTRAIGCVLALLGAAASAAYGLKRRSEMFVIYAWVYGLIALNIAVFAVGGETVSVLFGILSSIIAIAGLFMIHARMQDEVTA